MCDMQKSHEPLYDPEFHLDYDDENSGLDTLHVTHIKATSSYRLYVSWFGVFIV